jgi:hypothetical protein
MQGATQILKEYQQVGAVKLLPKGSPSKHLVPWFIIRKKEGEKQKLRLIADCRELNVYFQTTHFRLDHLQQIFPLLKQGMWGGKIDLRHAYLHL